MDLGHHKGVRLKLSAGLNHKINWNYSLMKTYVLQLLGTSLYMWLYLPFNTAINLLLYTKKATYTWVSK